MEQSVIVALFGFLGVVVTALIGLVTAVLTNKREPREVAIPSETEEELRRENAALQRMIDMLLDQLEKKP